MLIPSLLICGLSLLIPQAEEKWVLAGGAFVTVVDPETGRITVRSPAGEAILELPVGISVRPAWPPRQYLPRDLSTLERVRGDPQGAFAERLLAVRMDLTGPSGDRRISLAMRSGPFGPVLIYGLPGDLLRDQGGATELEPPRSDPVRFGRTRVDPASAGGEPRTVRSVSFEAPGRVSINLRSWVDGQPVRSFRLLGRFGIDSHSGGAGTGARLEILCDGELLYQSPMVSRGDAPQAFDLPLPDARGLAFQVHTAQGVAAAGVTAQLLGVALSGPLGRRHPLEEILAQAAPGLDLLVGADNHGEPTSNQLVLETAPWSSFQPAPLLLPLRAASGWLVGVGLAALPAATRLAYERERVTLNLPTTRLPGSRDPNGQLRLVLTVVLARDPHELLARYRAALVDVGAAVPVRTIKAQKEPDWWRRPLLLARNPPGSGRFRRFDAFEVRQRVEEVERRLGLSNFTLVLDGVWNRAPGDPAPAETFEHLRTLIAAQHVKGRKVLLGWDPGSAAPGSLAFAMGVAVGDRVAAGPGKRYRAYVREVAQSCLSDQLHTLNADGFLLKNLEPVGDSGLGLREIRHLLEAYARESAQLKTDALLLSACGLPQTVQHLGGFWLAAPAGVPRSLLDERAQLAAEALPELTIYCAPLSGSAEELLRWAVRSSVIGVPALSSTALARLDDRQAAALGAVLRLQSERRPGRPEWLPDGGCKLAFGGRVCAETLGRDRGLVVYPDRDRAALVVVEDGDLRLPFLPQPPSPADSAGPGSPVVTFDGERGAILRDARAGRIYRFLLRP